MQTKRRISWKEIDWIAAESYVNRLQVRIVKAVQAGKWRLVKRLQTLLCNSFYAKALAVRRVTTNKGKKTPGVDGVIWYWRSKANRQWIFRTDKQVLFQMSDMPIVRISSLDRTKNPYIDPEYFLKRRYKHKELRKRVYARSAAACGRYYAL